MNILKKKNNNLSLQGAVTGSYRTESQLKTTHPTPPPPLPLGIHKPNIANSKLVWFQVAKMSTSPYEEMPRDLWDCLLISAVMYLTKTTLIVSVYVSLVYRALFFFVSANAGSTLTMASIGDSRTSGRQS